MHEGRCRLRCALEDFYWRAVERDKLVLDAMDLNEGNEPVGFEKSDQS
jgi:hypothetical protein